MTWFGRVDWPNEVRKALDAGVTGNGGHWVTIDGHHVLIDDGPAHRGGRTRHLSRPLTKAAFEADVMRGPDRFFREQLRTREHGGRTDRHLDHDATTGPLGHYQFLDSTLINLGLKQRPGNTGWGNTPFAKAYGIKTNQDFLNDDAAQDAALAQFAKRAESEITPLRQYIGHRFMTADGHFITVFHAGLFAAIHKQGGDAVRDYFKENGEMILSDLNGQGLGRTRIYDETKPKDARDRNIEGRLFWAQYFNYQSSW